MKTSLKNLIAAIKFHTGKLAIEIHGEAIDVSTYTVFEGEQDTCLSVCGNNTEGEFNICFYCEENLEVKNSNGFYFLEDEYGDSYEIRFFLAVNNLEETVK